MSFLEELSRAAESPTAVWHQFAVSHDPRRDDWYLFLEGKLDVGFYVSALRSLIGHRSNVKEFRCGGKSGVLVAWKMVQRNHPGCMRCLFFVDKDLQEFVGESDPSSAEVFRTDCYSVENYFVNGDALDVVWAHLWSLPTNDPRRLMIKDRFSYSLACFYRAIVPIMAWIVLVKRRGLRPNINNINLADVFSLKDCLPVLCREAFAKIKRSTSCDHNPPLRDWIREVRRLRRGTPKCVVRGKFELWFFCRFLDSVFRTLRASAGDKPEGAIQVTPESVARALIGKIPIPESLQTFLCNAVDRGRKGHCGEDANNG